MSVDAPLAEPAIDQALPAPDARVPPPLPRWIALFEVILVSGIPTQILVASVLVFFAGFQYPVTGQVPLSFLAALSLIDTVVVIGLITLFLKLAGERARPIFLGVRPWRADALRGVLFVPVVVIVVALLVLTVRTIAPWTHTVETNPLTLYLNSPADAAVLLVVAVLAGGVREEMQRAFVLHRFGQYLGGVRVGLVLFTIVFGALHVDQGIDVAIAVGSLGLWWGLIYIRHRSAVMPMANHAAFNAVQVVQAFLARSAG